MLLSPSRPYPAGVYVSLARDGAPYSNITCDDTCRITDAYVVKSRATSYTLGVSYTRAYRNMSLSLCFQAQDVVGAASDELCITRYIDVACVVPPRTPYVTLTEVLPLHRDVETGEYYTGSQVSYTCVQGAVMRVWNATTQQYVIITTPATTVTATCRDATWDYSNVTCIGTSDCTCCKLRALELLHAC